MERHGGGTAASGWVQCQVGDFHLETGWVIEPGQVMVLFGLIYGGYWWYISSVTDVYASTGTVFLSALPIILGSQFLIAFFNFDNENVPKKPLHPML